MIIELLPSVPKKQTKRNHQKSNMEKLKKLLWDHFKIHGYLLGPGNGRRTKSKNIGFSKCCSDLLRGQHRRILGQKICQNFVQTLILRCFFALFCKKRPPPKSYFFDGFSYCKLPINRPWRPTSNGYLSKKDRRLRMCEAALAIPPIGKSFRFVACGAKRC